PDGLGAVPPQARDRQHGPRHGPRCLDRRAPRGAAPSVHGGARASATGAHRDPGRRLGVPAARRARQDHRRVPRSLSEHAAEQPQETSMSTRTGPFEQGQWPNRLRAAAVDASDRPRLHGYDIESDLARHYGAAELMLLALTQDAPTVHQGKAFEIALVFASTCPINEAPTHGARLARSFGAPVASAVTAGILLAFEASRAVIDEHRELLQWLRDGREGLLPPSV